MLQRGNTKLGNMHTFSLPAHTSCPGETEACASVCYATKGFFHMCTVKASHRRNFTLSKQSSFVPQMVAEIKQQKVKVLRVHVSGDLYSAAYIRKWVRIAKQCPGATFFLFTRSWRILRMVPALRDLSQLPNVRLWWSADKDTHSQDGVPPVWSGVRVAYLQLEHDDSVPAYTDLVFRNKRDTITKFVAGRLVCPGENGISYKPKMRCSRCGLCASVRSVPRASMRSPRSSAASTVPG